MFDFTRKCNQNITIPIVHECIRFVFARSILVFKRSIVSDQNIKCNVLLDTPTQLKGLGPVSESGFKGLKNSEMSNLEFSVSEQGLRIGLSTLSQS